MDISEELKRIAKEIVAVIIETVNRFKRPLLFVGCIVLLPGIFLLNNFPYDLEHTWRFHFVLIFCVPLLISVFSVCLLALFPHRRWIRFFPPILMNVLSFAERTYIVIIKYDYGDSLSFILQDHVFEKNMKMEVIYITMGLIFSYSATMFFLKTHPNESRYR